MYRPELDVIVVGAGAGGAAAAYYLQQAGLRVLVVEKAHLPRYKACGGAIPRPTLDRFPFTFDSVIRATPDAVRLAYPGLPPVDTPLPDEPVVMVMRAEFDAYLLARSEADVLEGTTVTGVAETDTAVRVEAGDRTLTARYVVGADGALSQVAKSLGLRPNRPLGGTLEAKVPLPDHGALRDEYGRQALFVFGAIPWGYVWVFPKGECLSVGIAHFRTGRVHLRSALQKQMNGLGIQLDGVKIHGHALPSYSAPAWPLWHIRDPEQLATRRCVLVGDAAGLVDPFLGEGLRYAIGSARLAAEAITRDDLSEYDRVVWQEMGHSLATAGLVARTFYRWPRPCFLAGVRNPAIMRLTVDLLTERQSYQGIGRRMMAATARWYMNSHRRTDEELITHGKLAYHE